jgi:hypothetical protein
MCEMKNYFSCFLLFLFLFHGYQIQDNTIVITVLVSHADGAEKSVPFEFNVKNIDLELHVKDFCLQYQLMSADCETLFDTVVKERYLYLEKEMLKSEINSGKGVINTQFIPNPHLHRTSTTINREINNHFKSQLQTIDLEEKLESLSQQIVDLMIKGETELTFERNIAFIHSCSIEGEDNRILLELLGSIIHSGLIERLQSLIICNYGIPVNSKVSLLSSFYPEKIHFFHVSNDTSYFEVPTMKIIHSMSQLFQNNNHNLLYLHTKGISYRTPYPQIEDWRHFMSYYLVERYQSCLHLLESQAFDAVGVNYKSNPRDFRGNFWWATTSYLSSLPMLYLQKADKYVAEKWVHMGLRYRYYSFHESGVDHHFERYEREKYVRVEEEEEEVARRSFSVEEPDPRVPMTKNTDVFYSALCVGGTVHYIDRPKGL